MTKPNPRDRKPSRLKKMPAAETWRTPRKTDFGRMVKPSELVAEYDQAAQIRMADQKSDR